MTNLIQLLNFSIALGGIALFFAAAVLIFDLYSKNMSFKDLLVKFGLQTAFAIVTLGSILTLIYSEIFGFAPCGLCWLQRVFLYPQVFMLATALYIKDKHITLYGIVLSAFGLIVALYQHYIQMGGAELITCPIANAGVSCAERTLFEFNFVTFPLISAFTFLLLIALYWYIHKVAQ